MKYLYKYFMMKILCTGNPSGGIAQSIQRLYPDTTFISRSNGYDLTTDEGIDKFKNIISNFNVFINHSQLQGTTLQRDLLLYTRKAWTEGYVINIGSVIEFKRWEWLEPAAAEEKRQLRDLSLELSSEHFKTTHLVVGGLQSCNNDPLRIHTDRVAETIKWILENENHIPLLYVDHVSDELIKRYLR
jgi:hypothetical protein